MARSVANRMAIERRAAVTRMPIGARIRAARRRIGMRQVDLAAASGVSMPVLSKIETGETITPGYGMLRAIAKAVGVGPAGLARIDTGTCSTRYDGYPVDVDAAYLLAAYRRLRRNDGLLLVSIAHKMLHAPSGTVVTFGWRGMRRCLQRGGNGNPARRTSTGRGRQV